MTLRAAFVLPGAGVVRRGAESFVLDLCRELPAHGIEAVVFGRGPVDVPHKVIRAVSRDSRWLTKMHGATRLSRKILDTLFMDPMNVEWTTAALSVRRELKRSDFDVVVMEAGLVGGWVARSVRRSRGSAFIDIAHGIDPKWESAFARNRPDRTVVFTEAFAGELQERVPQARIEVIPHGVNLEFFRQVPSAVPSELERPIFLAAGHLDEHKRFHSTLDAVAKQPRGSLVVLGNGPLADDLDRVGYEKLGTGRYLRANVERPELPGWFSGADCFTLASKTESFGLVYLEALACGTACVAPEDPIRREVIGNAGIFFDPSRTESYAAGLAEAVARDWGEVPRRRAAQFPFSRTVDEYARLFRAVAK